MHDVVRQIVIACRDKNLVARDRIAAILARHSLRRQQAEVSSTLRFGQAHRARPLAAHQLRQPGGLEFVGAVHQQRVIRPVTQSGEHAKTQVRRADHLLDGEAQRLRKALSAVRFIGRERRPARRHVLMICRLESARRADGALVDATALGITGLIDRLQHFFAELRRAFQHGHRGLVVELRVARQARQTRVVDHVVEHELHVVERGLVCGHPYFLSSAAACRWRAYARSWRVCQTNAPVA